MPKPLLVTQPKISTNMLSKLIITSIVILILHCINCRGYCWIHGTSYVRQHLQGRATGCYVDHEKIDAHQDALITSYYLWLPYLMSFLYALCKLPHSLWKRFFENNLINGIIGKYFCFIKIYSCILYILDLIYNYAFRWSGL